MKMRSDGLMEETRDEPVHPILPFFTEYPVSQSQMKAPIVFLHIPG